ncbi:Serpentine Receptor, class T [Caenorhabditis elegans]|uniref:Serpentine Receptor, class T n=1 Tax=Caenorhabditis elegans TaxID=6239 RepID=Q9GZF9_CAEEL|nr:Serpentine Receptor, class T [Caenorhabditis elegans]CCD63298.2 Serpentine Receptor, class T [Caenorhabditis elegans]|eukprot:NP_499955.3 Serpentine Receptor, class T [Caenorhabditis elegans]
MTVGCMILTMYLLCLYVIFQSELVKSSCYKIMLYLGLMDTCCLIVNSLITGYLGFIGATFCSYPRFIYVAGAIGCGCWMGSCSTCILLAANRCSDINHNLPIRKMFIGKNVYITMMIPATYTIYAMFFTKPIIFDSNYMSWFFNPNLGLNSDLYVNVPYTVNNCCVSVCTASVYAYLSLLIHWKNEHAQSEALSKTQKQVFMQSIIICTCKATAAFIYVYMQFFNSPPPVILFGEIAWQCAHASVCVVYITWNKTIRRKVLHLIIPNLIRNRMKSRVRSSITSAHPIMNLMANEIINATRTNSGTAVTVF